MGIPGLTARLAPYGESTQWRQPAKDAHSGSNTTRDLLIIDGPALAYHVYHRCLAANSHAKNAFDAFPSYEEISRTILEWLAHVETFDLQVHRIYFDGYLPDSKRDVRHARLQSYLKQLRLFRSARLKLQASAPQQVTANAQTSARAPAVPSATPARLYALPALPFLVAIVIETLLDSKYSNRTYMVPSEADVACAQEADKQFASIVLTSDSDLLLHCERSRVMLFNELETTDDAVLKGRIYTPHNIAQDHKCDNFRSIAYFMAQDNQRSVDQAAKLVMQAGDQASMNCDKWFNVNLAVHPAICASLAEKYRCISEAFAQRPDPRLSELLCQWLLAPNSLFPSMETAELRMYLPFLIDDPARASAWRASSRLRAVAYACLRFHKSSFDMYEVDRRGERILENAVPISMMTGWLDRLGFLKRSLDEVQEGSNAIESLRKWAVGEVIHGRWLDTGSSQITFNDVLRLIKLDGLELSWNAIHFKAQVEGMLYSLRMVEVVLRLRQDTPFNDSEKQVMQGILQGLERFSIRTGGLMTSPNEGLPIKDSDGRFVQKLREKLHDDSQNLQGQLDSTAAGRHQKSKKRRRQERSQKQPQKKRDDRNMYSVLAES